MSRRKPLLHAQTSSRATIDQQSSSSSSSVAATIGALEPRRMFDTEVFDLSLPFTHTGFVDYTATSVDTSSRPNRNDENLQTLNFSLTEESYVTLDVKPHRVANPITSPKLTYVLRGTFDTFRSGEVELSGMDVFIEYVRLPAGTYSVEFDVQNLAGAPLTFRGDYTAKVKSTPVGDRPSTFTPFPKLRIAQIDAQGKGQLVLDGPSGGLNDWMVIDKQGNDVLLRYAEAVYVNGAFNYDATRGTLAEDFVKEIRFTRPISELKEVVISGGEGNDKLEISTALTVRTVATGGPGSDEMSGGGGDDIFDAEGGDDLVTGRDGNDTINGGDGADRLFGGTGDDKLIGGERNSPAVLFADTFVGEAGTDTVHYGDRTDNVSVTNDGAADDGRDGESDDIDPSVERYALPRAPGSSDPNTPVTPFSAASLVARFEDEDDDQVLESIADGVLS